MRNGAGKRSNLVGLLLAAVGFMCLPAFLAFAQAGSIPSSRRSDIAYETAKPMLETALEAKGLKLGSDVYLRLTKEPAELTAFVADTDGKFQPFRTWPVCSVSGGLGPKLREGDGQAPEGFYAIKPGQMNPSSNYHLSFNLGYPNAFDRANGRTGSFLMVHGNCVSVGCFAMTDTGIEEIWTLMQAAYENGQTSIDVHIFPFPMTAANLKRHAGDSNAEFWNELAPAWTAFEASGRVPAIAVRNKVYVVSPTA